MVPLLRVGEHDVHAPSLTGLGDRAHLLSRGVNLYTHIRDVAALLEAQDLAKVILVGHSYGGMVITGAAESAPWRVSRLVYLDALAPRDGECGFDLLPGAREERTRAAGGSVRAWLSPPPPPEAFGISDPYRIEGARSAAGAVPVHTSSGRATELNRGPRGSCAS